MSNKDKPEMNSLIPDNDKPNEELRSRRDFLRSLGKWSAVLIGATVGGGLINPPDAAAWVNGGAAWVNARGGGGAGWVNRSTGGAGWINRSGGWVNAAGGGGAAWVNRAGAGGAAWVNRRGW